MDDFIKQLPKAELHAHLNGSVSKSTLQDLINDKIKRDENFIPPDLDILLNFDQIGTNNEDVFENVFPKFATIHEIIDSAEAVYKACYSVIRDFAQNDNVKYLELRSSPKCNLKSGLTRELYIDSMIKAIREASKNFDIVVRLIISIDRRLSFEMAQEIISSTKSIDYMVGIDLSGDPRIDGRKFYQLLHRAKNSDHLKLALHLAEAKNMNEEIEEFVNLPPDRIGHGTFLENCSEECLNQIRALKIPIEMCLTSNVKCRTANSYENHHFGCWWLNGSNPIILCTDDKGLFSTSLNTEYKYAAECFNLNGQDLQRLAKNGFEYSFLEPTLKQQLIQKYFPSV